MKARVHYTEDLAGTLNPPSSKNYTTRYLLAAALADLLHVNWYDDLNQLICSLLRTTHKGDTVLLAGRATTNLALAADAIRDSFSGHGAHLIASSPAIRFDPHQNQMTQIIHQ